MACARGAPRGETPRPAQFGQEEVLEHAQIRRESGFLHHDRQPALERVAADVSARGGR